MAHAQEESERRTLAVHIAPMKVLVSVWLALMALTALTVAITWVDLGSWNLIVAMAIATVKAALVVLFFMHMVYDRPFNAVVFIVALLFVALFVSGTLMDAMAYQGDLIPGYAPSIPQ